MRRWVLAVVFALALLGPAGANADAEAPWRAAERVRASLFDAQTALLLGEAAPRSVDAANHAFEASLAAEISHSDAAALHNARSALDGVARAYRAGDAVELAAARGQLVAAIRRGAYAVTLGAVSRGELATARDWILVRDFRKATRFTRPGVDATAALDALAAGDLTPAEARTQVKKDLLDAYQARLNDYLAEAEREADRGFMPALAESAALVRGYWLILDQEYLAQRGEEQRTAADAAFRELEQAAAASRVHEFERRAGDVRERLDGFTAAPFTAEEQVRRAAQLTRFLDLVPIEYDHGTDDGQVTIPFELQEGLAFIDGAQAAFDDLEPELDEHDPAASAEVEVRFDELRRLLTAANEGGVVVSLEEVEAVHEEASSTLDSLFPEEWKQSNDEADFDLVDISLDQMAAAISAGEKNQAEQARLSAYAFFEFGPEVKLRAFDPQLVAEIEGLFWYGARGADGFAELIADGADANQVRESRLVMDEALEEARAQTGEGASDATVITNAATIVFREGLEAILIIAAITASMVGANRRLRRPVLRGALLALPASVILFVIALLALDSLAQYGEKLEAIVGIVAIAVLLLVMNWFFHRVYWTAWISGHRKRGLATAAAVGVGGATVAGLYLLGFSSVLREGFETVLFLQALQLSSGTGVVVAGVGFGLIATAVVGAVTFNLEQRLPYKRMLIVTGVLIALVLVVLVGNTARTMQGIGWLSITPIDVELPLWMGTWLGIFPTVETLVLQAGAFALVIGSYFAAEWWRKRRVRPEAPSRPLPATVNGDAAPEVLRRLPVNGVPRVGAHDPLSRTPDRTRH